MKDNARSLKRRLKSVSSIGQMTNAVKTVAAAKYNRSFSRLSAVREYRKRCMDLLAETGIEESPVPDKADKVLYVLVTANRGLCGSYNQDIWKLAQETFADQTAPYRVLVCGRWGASRATEHRLAGLAGTLEISDIPSSRDADSLAGTILRLWETGEYTRVDFIVQRFQNILNQSPVIKTLWPMPKTEAISAGMLFLPDRETVMRKLIKRAFSAAIHESLMAAMTGAHGATLMAMRTASDNAREMAEDLERSYNHIRQTLVTTQVLELSRVKSEEEEQE